MAQGKRPPLKLADINSTPMETFGLCVEMLPFPQRVLVKTQVRAFRLWAAVKQIACEIRSRLVRY